MRARLAVLAGLLVAGLPAAAKEVPTRVVVVGSAVRASSAVRNALEQAATNT